jgi:cysteine desulfurase
MRERRVMTSVRSYFDYNATVPAKPEVITAMIDALALGGNPSSVHGAGRIARRMVEDARAKVAGLVNAKPNEIVFTSGGTEANNLALMGLEPHYVLVSATEHDSVLAAVGGTGADCGLLPVDENGVVDLAELENLLKGKERPVLVSIHLANNQTGVVQPIAEAARIAHEAGAYFHCDAVQAAGRLEVDFTGLDVDLMTLSAHKIGGPQGTGALVVRDGLDLQPAIRGGGQENRRRAGTENLAGIAGFGAAAALAPGDRADMARIAALRDDLERRLIAASPAAKVFGRPAARLANTSCISMPGVSSETQVMALDLAGVEVSAGSACSAGKVTRSHVLEAMAVDLETNRCAIRISLGWKTAPADVERLVEAWTGLYARTRQSAGVDDSRREAGLDG